jgi:hypothetical protein
MAAEFISDQEMAKLDASQPTDEARSPAVAQPAGVEPPDFISDDALKSQEELRADKYDNIPEQLQAAGEGALDVTTGGLGPKIQETLRSVVPGYDPFKAEERLQERLERAQENPISRGVGQVAGLVGTGAGGLLGRAGATGAEALGLGAEAAIANAGSAAAKELAAQAFTPVARLGSSAAKSAIENMIFQGTDEVAKMLMNDPDQTAGSALLDVGLSGTIGALVPVGGAIGKKTVEGLWNVTKGSKLTQVLKTLADKAGGIEGQEVDEALQATGLTDQVEPQVLGSLKANPLMQQATSQILQDSASASGVAHREGLKAFKGQLSEAALGALGKTADDVAELEGLSAAQSGEKIISHISDRIETTLKPIEESYNKISNKFKDVPLAPEAKSSLAEQVASSIDPGVSPSSPEANLIQRVLKEIPNLKNLEQVRNYASGIGRETSGIAKQEFWGVGKKLKSAFDTFEEGVLNAEVAEKAPELLNELKATNTAYKQLKGQISDLNDRLRVGPHAGPKTFIRQLKDLDGEAIMSRLNPKNKSSIIGELQNYPEILNAVRDFQLGQVLKKAARTPGAGEHINTNTLLKDLKGMSPEMRSFLVSEEGASKLEAVQELLASIPEKIGKSGTPQGLSGWVPRMAGGAIAMATMVAGHNPITAALVGKLTQILGRDVPDAARLALLKYMGSAQKLDAGGFKAMVDYIQKASRGQKLLADATKNVFTASKMVIPSGVLPTEKKRKRLEKALEEAQLNPDSLINTSDKTGHYLPEHGQSTGMLTASAIQYLNSIRPLPNKKSPLDKEVPVSQQKKTEYQNALNIAEQPLIVFDKIQKGTLTSKDLVTLKTIYPKIYESFSTKLMKQMTDTVAAGKSIPYRNRMGLSLFLGQPLDSTLTPEGIVGAQPKGSGESRPQAGTAAHTSKQTSKLGKSNSMYQTPLQSRQRALTKN